MEKLELSPQSGPPESLVEMSRLNNLSDAVFAVALTLLVLDIHIPEGIAIGDLPGRLLELAPNFLVYLISFVVIGGAWGSHQRMLQQIKRGDGLLVWFNLFSLLFVTLSPASAALLGHYPDAFIAIACFAIDVALIQLTALWMWRHASRHGLINSTLDARVVESIGRRLNLSTVIFLLSIPLALLNTWLIYLFWIGLFILLFTTDWLSWQQAALSQQASLPLEDTKRARIHIQHGAGHLQIDSQAEDSALFNGVFGGGLESRVDRSDDSANIQLRVSGRQSFLSLRYPWSWGPANVLDWSVHLTNQIPLALEIETASGQSMLDFRTLQITDLKLTTSASSTQISLPDREGDTMVHIEASTASLVLLVPPEVAAYIHGQRAAANIETNLERFLMIQKGSEYRSPDYETAAKRVDISVEVAMGSIKIF